MKKAQHKNMEIIRGLGKPLICKPGPEKTKPAPQNNALLHWC